jgi:hypothetical protein
MEKKLSKGNGRPEFFITMQTLTHLRWLFDISIVVLEFSRLKKFCRYEKGGYCKLARNTCAT